MKRNKNGKKWNDFPFIFHDFPKFSDFLQEWPQKRLKTTENDRENGSSGKRLRNEKERNGMIFHSFSMIFRVFSSIFRENSVYLHRFN